MRTQIRETDISRDTNASTNPEQEAKVNNLKNDLDQLVREGKLKSEYVDFIMQESIKPATDQKISYTGILTTWSIGGGQWLFSSYSGDFILKGTLGPAAGFAFFFWARFDIFPQYNYNGCTGYMSFRLAPIGMDIWLSMDDKGNIPVANGIAAGPAAELPAGGIGTFTLSTTPGG